MPGVLWLFVLFPISQKLRSRNANYNLLGTDKEEEEEVVV